MKNKTCNDCCYNMTGNHCDVSNQTYTRPDNANECPYFEDLKDAQE